MIRNPQDSIEQLRYLIDLPQNHYLVEGSTITEGIVLEGILLIEELEKKGCRAFKVGNVKGGCIFVLAYGSDTEGYWFSIEKNGTISYKNESDRENCKEGLTIAQAVQIPDFT